MKRTLYSCLLAITVVLTSCTQYVDIVPKGRNTLSTISDLDLVLNYNFVGAPFNFDDLSVLVNDNYPQLVNLTSAINLPLAQQNPYLTYQYTTPRITPASDSKYDRLYAVIAAMNIVINGVDQATGDKTKAASLKAEALIYRAYMHYLIVNVFARAYNPATAATDGGIPYVTSIDLETPNKKSTVAEVYQFIQADINAALTDLPTTRVSIMRPGKAFGYALKAQVLKTVRDYAGALTAANTSLTYNSTLEDHTAYPTAGVTRSDAAPDNLVYIAYIASRPLLIAPSIEVLSQYEPGNIIRYYTTTYKTSTSYGTISNSPTGNGTVYYWSVTNYAQNAAGLTTEDVILTKAECLARTGKISEAMDVINAVRVKRIKASDYKALTATTEQQAMAYLMRLARIEHLFTYKNFVDIKRWNTEDQYKQTITRTINTTTLTLTPDSPLWIFPFPQSGTNYNPELTQNY